MQNINNIIQKINLSRIQATNCSQPPERHSDSASHRQPQNPSTASSAELEALAGALLAEIEWRWSGQAKGWGKNKQQAAAWARGLQAAGAPAPELLRLALERVTVRPYPPDLGLLLSQALEPIPEGDARASWARVCAAVAQPVPPWHTLTAVEVEAVTRFGIWDLRHAQAVAFERWWRILNQVAVEALAGADFPQPPDPPAGLLVRRATDEEKARARAQLAEAKKMLG